MLNHTKLFDWVPGTPFLAEEQACEDGLLVRLATGAREVDAAQALRYRVFFEEGKGHPSVAAKWRRRDFDVYDAVADHLLVLDAHRGSGDPAVVGTCRLLRGRAARAVEHCVAPPGFRTAAAFNIEPLLCRAGEILEVGRACIDPDYRSRGAMELLWQGIATYVHAFNVNLMFGMVGFEEADPNALFNELAFLHHNYRAPPELRPHAHPERFVPMDRMPAAALDERRAWKSLPPLVKEHIRLGGVFGDGAVIDRESGGVQVCVVAPVARIADRYLGDLRKAGPRA